jgi:hypothetical protein
LRDEAPEDDMKPTTVTAMGARLAMLCAAAALASCVDAPATDEPDQATAQQALTPWSAPRLKWILYGTPGTAKLARRDLVTGVVSVLKTHAFDTHWRPVSIAGNKLLWQRTDTGEVSLWTIDSAGNYVRHNVYAPPGPGYRAASIALSDDGACPAMLLQFRTYVITFEGGLEANSNIIREAAPVLWMVDDAGAILSTDTLPNAANLFSTIRDFRPEKFGRWALVTVPTGIALFSGSVSYYDRSIGTWLRLRTDSYSASGGLISCALDTLPPPLSNPTSCATNFVDSGPGAGYALSGFQLAQDVTSNNMANNLLWTRSDGTAAVYALDALGQQTTAPTPLVSGLAGYRAESLAGADESPGFPLICDHRPQPIPRPGDFDDL